MGNLLPRQSNHLMRKLVLAEDTLQETIFPPWSYPSVFHSVGASFHLEKMVQEVKMEAVT